MTAVLLGHFEPNSAEWHAARRNGLGASEIAAVVGLSPFESAFSLWHRKKGNLPGPDPANPLFYWGHALEPLVAARYASEHPEFHVVPVGTYADSERSWQIANLDRALYDRATVGFEDAPVAAVLEIKTTRYGDNWGPHRSDHVPLHVRCQVMQQMDVMGVPFADVAVLIGGNDYREYRVDYDEADATTLREAGAAFWASLQTDDEPPVDASWATYEAVRDLHPEINGEDVEVDPILFASYDQSKGIAEAANAAHRQAKSALLAAMGEARRALVNDLPVLRRQPGRNGSVSLYPIAQKESA